MNKWVKILMWFSGFVLLLGLLLHFGFHLWLKFGLPNYLKEGTGYSISYHQLEVGLLQGDILATGIKIENKSNDARKDQIQISGSIDTLYIGKLGIYDALIKKRINTDTLQLVSPKLEIKVPLAKNSKENAQHPIVVKNLEIKKGDLNVSWLGKLFSTKGLNLKLENISFANQPEEKKLPFTFSSYDINTEKLYYNDAFYIFTLGKTSTKDRQLKIKDFSLKPKISFQKFRDSVLDSRFLIQAEISEIWIKDINLEEQAINFSNFYLQNPKIELHISKLAAKNPKKFIPYLFSTHIFEATNADVKIYNEKGNPTFSVQKFNTRISDFSMDKKQNSVIPFSYQDCFVEGNNLFYKIKNQYNINVDRILGNLNKMDIKGLKLKPISSSALFKKNGFVIDLEVDSANLKQINLKKDDFNFSQIAISNPKITIRTANKKTKEKFEKTIKSKVLNINNANIQVFTENEKKIFSSEKTNFHADDFSLGNNRKGFWPFSYRYFLVSGKNIAIPLGKYYSSKMGSFQANPHLVKIERFAMIPNYSREKFIKIIPHEKDYYQIDAKKIEAKGNHIFSQNSKKIIVNNIIAEEVNAEIFRSKIPKDDVREKPMYSKLMRSIKIPIYVKNVGVKNSKLTYEEDNPDNNNRIGKLMFTRFNLSLDHFNSNKIKNKPTEVLIKINCYFMNTSPMSVNWNFNTTNLEDQFSISGKIKELSTQQVDLFTTSHNIKTTGTIGSLNFNFSGNNSTMNGAFDLEHKNLEVEILNKKNQEKRRFVSGLANAVVRRNSKPIPKRVAILVQRNKQKSFFNFFWLGLQDGLKKSLIPFKTERIEKKIEKIKNRKANKQK